MENGASPTPDELKETIQRNFGGYFGDFKPALQFIKSFNPDFIENNLIPAKGNLEMFCVVFTFTYLRFDSFHRAHSEIISLQ